MAESRIQKSVVDNGQAFPKALLSFIYYTALSIVSVKDKPPIERFFERLLSGSWRRSPQAGEPPTGRRRKPEPAHGRDVEGGRLSVGDEHRASSAGGSHRECGGLSDTPQSYNVICSPMVCFSALKRHIVRLHHEKARSGSRYLILTQLNAT